jgi:DNA-binding MarR family transcriptional regulator
VSSATRPRPTDTLAADVRLAVGRLARRLRQQASAGLTPSQFSALSSIEVLAPVRLVDLAAAERVSAPTMTKVVGSLVDAGMVDRVPDVTDRRAHHLSLTPAGRTVLRQVRSERTARLAERLAQLSPAERHLLERALPVLAALAADPPAEPRS